MHATTHYSVIDRVAHKAAWVSLKPVTGRQHQLRAHMALIGNPIVGDNKYEGDKALADSGIEAKLHLHARRLVIPHPSRASQRSTSRRRCPSTCAGRGSCWGWMPGGSMRIGSSRRHGTEDSSSLASTMVLLRAFGSHRHPQEDGMATPVHFDSEWQQFLRYARLVAGRGYVHNTLGNMAIRARRIPTIRTASPTPSTRRSRSRRWGSRTSSSRRSRPAACSTARA